MSYQEWTYHGIYAIPESRLSVEEPESGYTERETAKVLRELPGEGAGWGYNGNSTSRVAARILADALDLGDPNAAGMEITSRNRDDTLTALCEDFCDEVLMQMASEWRLSRIAILRWVLGWYTQHGISTMPAVLREIPYPGTIQRRKLGLPPRKAAQPPQ